MLPLIILTGPTTSKKSQTALALAEKLDTEIIGADSLQVYKYFDIGSAKPSREIRAKVPHHLIDILEPEEDFNAFDFKIRALDHIRDLMDRGKIPLLTGGTGLYLKVLMRDYDCAVSASKALRTKTQREIRAKGLAAVYEELKKVDPEAAANIESSDPIRIERALSVYRETGRRFSDFHFEDNQDTAYDFPIHLFYLDWDRKTIYEQINRRVDEMIETGLVEEVEDLLARNIPRDAKPFHSIGYAQMVSYLEGRTPLAEAVDDIKRKTRNYAKRQYTWFRNMAGKIPIRATASDTAATLRDKILSLMPKAASLLAVVFMIFSGTPSQAKEPSHYQEGARLFHEGDFAWAKNKLLRAQSSSREIPQRRRVQYLLGLTFNRLDQPEMAIKALGGLLKSYPEMEDYVRFALGEAYLMADRNEAALAQFDSLLNKYPQTLHFAEARLTKAEALSKLGRNREAIETLEKTLESLLRESSKEHFKERRSDVMLRLAENFSRAGEPARAHEFYRKLFIEYPNHSQIDAISREMNRIPKQAGFSPKPLTLNEWGQRIRGFLKGARHQQAIDAILKIQRTNHPLPERFYFHLIDAYRGQRRRDLANESLREFLRRYPNSARASEAFFRMGRNLWNLDKDEEGNEFLEKAIQRNPDSRWAIRSRYIIGRIHEGDKDYPKAIRAYIRLVHQNKKDDYSQQGAWRLAWVYYLKGDYAKALESFRENNRLYPNGILVESNLFWSAKSAEKMGNRAAAKKIYQEIFSQYPFTYYGIRSKNKLAELGASGVGDWGKLPAVKKVKAEPADALTPKIPKKRERESRFRYTRAGELMAMGFSEQAALEIRQLEPFVKKDFSGILWLTRLYNRAQSYSDSVRLLHRYKNQRARKDEKDLPELFWRHMYPIAHGNYIHKTARHYDVDPFFVQSIIRQESLFNHRAVSPAGARGLMQIMPETARKLHSRANLEEPFLVRDLFDPELNLRLGMQYVNELNGKYGKNGTYVLISYNAGPHVLEEWLVRFQDIRDPDVFIESLPYSETRNYVKRVMRNYGIYQSLYDSP